MTFTGDISGDVAALQGFFGQAGSVDGVQAIPARATHIPLWILGTSFNGARIAARLGLPFVFGAHLSPGPLMPAIDVYRTEFQPSEQLQQPYLMVGVNVVAAATDEEAARLSTSYKMTVTDLVRGRPGRTQAPVDDIDTYWSTPERHALTNGLLARMVVGSPKTIKERLGALIAETGADELIIDTDLYNHQDRLASVKIIAEAVNPATRHVTEPGFAQMPDPRRTPTAADLSV